MDERIYDCIVIGGGISGISFAYYLNKADKSVLLLDNREKAGGQIQTGQSVTDPGYRFEMGAHTCYNSYTNLASIINDLKINDSVQAFARYGYTVYAKGKVKSIVSELSVLRMLPACFRHFSSDKAGKTVREYFRPIVGGGNYDHLFKHAFKAVICQPADDYPAEIFLKKRDTRDKTLPRKFGFKHGMSSFIDSILNRIESLPSVEIVKINRANDLFTVEAKDGKRFRSGNIALATDVQTASSLLKDIAPDVSDVLSSVASFHSESLNVIVPKDRLKIRKTAGIINLSDEFMSAVSRDLVSDEKRRSFTFHFAKGSPDKVNLICKVLDIHPSDIAEQKSSEHTLPARRLPDIDLESKMDARLKNGKLYVTGNYFKGLSMEDCVTRSKREAERFLTLNS